MKLKIYTQNETLEEFEEDINKSIDDMAKDGFIPIDFKPTIEPTQGVVIAIMFNKVPEFNQSFNRVLNNCKKKK